MSIVNQLSYSQRRRDRMVNNRNGFTYIANITVLVVALILFLVISNGTLCFSILTIFCLSIGTITTGFYICRITEKSLSSEATRLEAKYREELGGGPVALPEGVVVEKKKGKQWSDWIKEGQFYIFGCVYMFARIALNVNATIMPFYLSVVTGFGDPTDPSNIPPQVAIVPLCSYTCSLVWSIKFQAPLTQKLRNRLIPIGIACVISAVGYIPFLFLSEDPSTRWLIYPCACLQGIGIAILLNTGTSLISDVIGKDSQSSAFVYGIYSLMDKFANGFLLYWLVANYSDNGTALKWIIVMVPMGAAVGTLFFTWLGLSLYSDKLAKISEGSMLRKKGVAPVARKGSVAVL